MYFYSTISALAGLLLVICAVSNALVQQVPVKSVRVSARISSTTCGTSSGMLGTLNTVQLVQDFYQWLLIGSVSVGTPPTNFTVGFSHWDSDFYLTGLNAVYRHHKDSSNPVYVNSSEPVSSDKTSSVELVTDKQEFDPSVSSTYQAANVNYTNRYTEVVGEVGSDIVGIDSINANLTFGVLSEVDFFLADTPVDGVFGTDPQPDEGNSLPSALQQLISSGQLDAPLITRYINRPQDEWTGGEGVIVLGGSDSPYCNPNFTHLTNSSYFGLPTFNVSAVGSHSVNYTVLVADWWWPIYVDAATQQVFVDATNATASNSLTGYCNNSLVFPLYSVDNSKLAMATDVVLQGAGVDGSTLVLRPSDYIRPYNDTISYMYVLDSRLFTDCFYFGASSSSSSPSSGTGEDSGYGYGYDDPSTEEDGSEEMPIENNPNWFILGQQFVNSHCLSTNILTGEMTISSASAGIN